MQKHQPPKLASKLLTALLPRADQEVFLGDFEELYYQRLSEADPSVAWRAYWLETLHSAPALALRKLRRPQEWLVLTSGQVIMRPSWKTSLLSLLALIPISIHLIPWWITFFSLRLGLADPGIGYDLLLKPLIYDYGLGHLVLNLYFTLGGLTIAVFVNLLGLICVQLYGTEKRQKLEWKFKAHILPLVLIVAILISTYPWLRYIILINTQ